MKLEIKISETVYIKDGLPEAMETVSDEIKKWYESDSKTPLVLKLSKVEDRGPPALGIHVSDKLNIKTLLR